MADKNPIQSKIESMKAESPIQGRTRQSIAIAISNVANKSGQTMDRPAWNKGKKFRSEDNPNYQRDGKELWGKTRRERGEAMTEQERLRYFGYKERHDPETIEQMRESARKRWAKTMRKVHTEDGVFDNYNQCAEHYQVHKDTVVYRIKSNSERYKEWYYIEDRDF